MVSFGEPLWQLMVCPHQHLILANHLREANTAGRDEVATREGDNPQIAWPDERQFWGTLFPKLQLYFIFGLDMTDMPTPDAYHRVTGR